MPRPGPRPYECVRRGWHSDRHQRMRGLIIQQIFRLVQAYHCAETKKNREWLEKLPVVVLKSEEIMYSKANSEAEYSNSETLWERVLEAIDTIIRKDESTETGELLPPCIEAALNLGCVPVRASRSQRNNNLPHYLRPLNEENSNVALNVPNENASEHQAKLMPWHTASMAVFKMPPTLDPPCLALESNKHPTLDTDRSIASSNGKFPCTRNDQCAEMGFDSMGSVYPLYYDTSFKPESSWLGFQESRKLDDIIVGVPVLSPVGECFKPGHLQNLFPYATDKKIIEGTSLAVSSNSYEKEPQIGCDLSLRLGLFSSSSSSAKNVSDSGTDNIDFRVSQVGYQHKDKEFHFFPMESTSAYDPTRLQASNWNPEVENQNAEVICRKRKPSITIDVDDEPCSWSNDPISNNFPCQMKWSGL